jgi:NAD(P)H-hydrate epimerase
METSIEKPLRTAGTISAPVYIMTAAEMAAVDKRSMTSYGIPTDRLMEAAGAGTVETMVAEYGDLYGYRVAVVCGRGHNGGDGLVVARRLAQLGAVVEVGVLAPLAELEGVVAVNLGRLQAAGVEPSARLDEDDVKQWLGSSTWDYVVDAVLGTGSRGDLAGLYAAAAEAVMDARAAGARVVAVDLPTGLETDTGCVGTGAVRADLTVTYAYPKRGHVLYPGRTKCGVIEIIDIGIPPEAAEDEGCRLELFGSHRAAALAPRRTETAHKGSVGKGLLIGGTVGLSGAVTLAAEASLRTGLGMVFAAIPRSINTMLESRLTEPITLPVPEDAEKGLSETSLPTIMKEVERVAAVGIGPGLGLGMGVTALVTGLLSKCEKPIVADADALTALSRAAEWPEKHSGPLVITPHVGEMSRLTGLEIEEIERRRIDVALEWAARWNVIVVLKGAPTVTASPDGRASLNSSGNPGMASAGMGDVLTGCILALLGQGLTDYDAARLGVYLHGRGADRVCRRRGAAICLAGEVGSELPAALGELSAMQDEPPIPLPLPESRRVPSEAEPPPDPGQ